jgi:arylsulfatase A-like enzyme
VPMMVRWPGRIKAGAASSMPWAFWDFLPTAADIAGVTAPEGLDGVSALPLLTGGAAPQREFLYWEFNTFDLKTGTERPGRLAQAVRMGDWKAVRPKPGAPLELYNLRTDMGEKNDVAAQNPRVVGRIEAYLKTARSEPRLHNLGRMDWAK